MNPNMGLSRKPNPYWTEKNLNMNEIMTVAEATYK
jgi:hypothetical protein